MNAYIVDTESNGLQEPLHPEVIELAVGGVMFVDNKLSIFPVFQGRFLPDQPSLPGALAVHHILPEELEGKPASALARAHLPSDLAYIIGHGVDYDADILQVAPTVKRICTLAMSRALWPTGQHNLSAMIYQLALIHKTDLRMIRERLRNAHSAWADVEFCSELLEAILKLNPGLLSWEDLWRYSEECRVPKIWAFGKHKGLEVAKTDNGYLLWCLRQPDMDEYVKTACRRALGRE